MESKTIALLNFIEESKQLEIPIYQRTYSWEKENCEQLWEDIVQIGQAPADEFEPEHFVGTVIYIEKQNGQARYVIDGQQRLTTVALIVEALARNAQDNPEQAPVSAEELRLQYLYDPNEAEETEETAHKLLLSATDKETLMAFVTQQEQELSADFSIRIDENFNLFRKKIRAALKSERAALWTGLKRLTIIAIALDQSQESPQRIFESMNDRGVELSNGDLIRNYVLMGLRPAEQEALYEAHWEPMEAELGRTEQGYDHEAFSKYFDAFIRYYLGMKNGKLPAVKKVYGAFKEHAADQKEKSVDAQTLVADIHRYAGYYSAIKLGREKNDRLNAAFNDLQLLKMDMPIPVLMALYHLYSERGAALRVLKRHLPNHPTEELERAVREMRDTGDISSFSEVIGGNSGTMELAQMHLLGAEQFEQYVRIIEFCVVRRSVCAIRSNGMAALFAKYALDVHDAKQKGFADIQVQKMPKGLKCPSDSDIAAAFKENILWGKNHCAYILRRMENYGNAEPLNLDDYKAAPIRPEGPSLPDDWLKGLGGTIGNLTLKGKDDLRLWLNESVPDDLQQWDAQAIEKRAEILAERALKVWPTP